MAEIEHFCDPSDKSHPKFDSVKDIEVTLYSACNQMNGELPEKRKIGDAVKLVSCSNSHRLGNNNRGFVRMTAILLFLCISENATATLV